MLRGNPAVLPTIIREMAATYGSGGNETGDRVENAALTGALGGAGLGIGKILDYLVDTGKYLFSSDTPEYMASQILKNSSDDPANLRANLNAGMENKAKLYPNVPFNSSDIMDGADTGINSMVLNTANKKSAFGNLRDKQYEAQNQFILDELNDLAGVNPPGASILRDDYDALPGESAKNYLKRVRKEESSPYWDEFDNGDWVNNKAVRDALKKMRVSPNFRKAENAAIKNYKNRTFEKPSSSGNSIIAQNIDQQLKALRQQKLEKGNFNYKNPDYLGADATLKRWREHLYNVSPQYRDAVTAYAENSPRLNSMEIFKEIRDKSLTDYGKGSLRASDGVPDEAGGLSANRLYRVSHLKDRIANKLSGQNNGFSGSVLDEDAQRFDNLVKLLSTRTKSQRFGRATGSDTNRLFTVSDEMKDRVTNTAFPQLSPSRPIRFANFLLRNAFDRRKKSIDSALDQAAFDPAYLSSILKKTTPQDTYVRGTWGDGLNLYGLTMSEGYQD